MTPTVLCRSAAFGLLTAAALAAAGPAWAAPSAEAVDAIDAGYAAFGGPASLLGAPAGEAVDAPGGAMRDYQGGAIFYSQATGAHVVYGAILDRYRALGGPGGTLGYPLNDESDTGDGVGRFNDFSAHGGAAVYWTPESGPTVVSGRILDAWRSSGGVAGPFGYPTADSALSDGVQTGTFAGPAGTQIQWSTAAGLVTVPAELAATIPGFAPGEGTPMPTPPPTTAASVSATPNPAAPTSSGGHQRWWWIAGVAAAALLVGLLALLARRRRGEAEVIGHQPAAPAVRPPAPRPAGPAPVPPPRPTPEPPRPSPAPAARPAPVTQPAPRVRPVPLAAVAPHARTEPTPPPAGRHSPAAGRTGPPTPPPLPTPPPPPPPPPPLRVVGPPKPAPLRAVPTDGDAAPVINYETHQPAESAIRVTYANNAVGDHEEGPADKSDQGQR